MSGSMRFMWLVLRFCYRLNTCDATWDDKGCGERPFATNDRWNAASPFGLDPRRAVALLLRDAFYIPIASVMWSRSSEAASDCCSHLLCTGHCVALRIDAHCQSQCASALHQVEARPLPYHIQPASSPFCVAHMFSMCSLVGIHGASYAYQACRQAKTLYIHSQSKTLERCCHAPLVPQLHADLFIPIIIAQDMPSLLASLDPKCGRKDVEESCNVQPLSVAQQATDQLSA